tara:strand:+ start:2401 stop:2832 length:432 start_codon:yes stop_codon:yes gene_type:complete
MSFDKQLAKELEEIVLHGLAQVPIPYEKGNSIRVKNIVIRKHKNGYRIFDISNNKHVVTTFTKTAALAIAKIVAERGNSNNIKDIIVLDNKVCKHYMDALFAKRAIEVSKDITRIEASEVKFDIATDRAWSSLAQIESYIFDK